jgi:hypothetical protein
VKFQPPLSTLDASRHQQHGAQQGQQQGQQHLQAGAQALHQRRRAHHGGGVKAQALHQQARGAFIQLGRKPGQQAHARADGPEVAQVARARHLALLAGLVDLAL